MNPRNAAEAKMPDVTMTIEGHVCVISLDNTAKKNAITPALMSQLSTHLTTIGIEMMLARDIVIAADNSRPVFDREGCVRHRRFQGGPPVFRGAARGALPGAMTTPAVDFRR